MLLDKTFEDHLPKLSRIHLDCNLTDQAYTFHLHGDETEMVYIASGKGMYMINHQYFHVEKGDFLIIERGFVHAGTSSSHDPMRALVAVVSDLHWKSDEYPENVIAPVSYPVIRAEEHIHFISGSLAELYYLAKEANHNKDLCQLILASLLVFLRSNYMYVKPFWEIRHNPVADDILSYIYIHYAENITLEHLSQQFYMSAGHINHLLQKEFHVSPINYLIDVRLSKAKNYLLNTNMSIPDIAYTTGYNNPAHFTKLFLKRTGYSPNDYRLLHANIVADEPAVPDIFA
ncbi:MAG: helix-turn-helix domain-containing protein [Lachnospiraceae bacterium]|nr:helix-turn-helix domain-containing protein [Lachnospiraceae bacterium]